ncbi:hypothetical protein Sjap_021292 [Stephania japonica]|uniref:Uncharacterized protein n=1 Tax=Stephania japonica TaxID=461633 RepID=A0AAP0EPA3_9MAGN
MSKARVVSEALVISNHSKKKRSSIECSSQSANTCVRMKKLAAIDSQNKISYNAYEAATTSSSSKSKASIRKQNGGSFIKKQNGGSAETLRKLRGQAEEKCASLLQRGNSHDPSMQSQPARYPLGGPRSICARILALIMWYCKTLGV